MGGRAVVAGDFVDNVGSEYYTLATKSSRYVDIFKFDVSVINHNSRG